MATKVVLTIKLPGGQLYDKATESSNPREYTDLLTIPLNRERYNKKTKKMEYVQEILHAFPRKCIPATQTQKHSYEAWEYMQSKDSCPSTVKPGIWVKMTKKDRLLTHFRNEMHDRGGISFTYEVLED